MEIPNSEYHITLFCWDSVQSKAYGLTTPNCVACNVKNLFRFDCSCGFKGPVECHKVTRDKDNNLIHHSVKNTAVNGIIEHLKDSHGIYDNENNDDKTNSEMTITYMLSKGRKKSVDIIKRCATVLSVIEGKRCKTEDIFTTFYHIGVNKSNIKERVRKAIENNKQISLDDIVLLNEIVKVDIESLIKPARVWHDCINYFAEVGKVKAIKTK